MPSEKLRYLKRNRGPKLPLQWNELMAHLPSLGSNRLAKLLWMRAENDDVVRKALIVSVALRLACGDLNKTKKAIDYALYFPDYIPHTEHGHGLILEEIRATLEHLVKEGQRELTIRVAQYAIERGEAVADNFEDNWDWTYSLDRLIAWTKKIREADLQ